MISISTNPIDSTFQSTASFKSYFENLENIVQLFNCAATSNLRIITQDDVDKRTLDGEHELHFIIKKVAWFKFKSPQSGDKHVQLDSSNTSEFKSAIRFEFDDQNNSIQIHMETDTNVFMELFLERRLKKFIANVVDQLPQNK